MKRSHVIKLITSIYYIYIAELPAMFSVVVVVSWVKEQVWKGESWVRVPVEEKTL